MMGYINIILKSVTSYICLLFFTRLMGRKQMSQLTFFDYVVGITIGSIAGSVSTDRTININDGLLALTVWSALPILTAYITFYNVTLRRIIDSEPLILINRGILNYKNMKKARYNIGDLLMQLRERDVFDFQEVEAAVLEPNGELSVIKKPEFSNVTLQDLNITGKHRGLMNELIIDGRIIESHLSVAGRDKKWLLEELEKRNVKSLQDVVLAVLQSNGNFYMVLKNK